MEGRLRRLCEQKPSGAIRVPKEIHDMWKRRGADRGKLLEIFMEVGECKETRLCIIYIIYHIYHVILLLLLINYWGGCAQSEESFEAKVKKTHLTLKRSANKKRRGWFNKDAMARKLLWTKLTP